MDGLTGLKEFSLILSDAVKRPEAIFKAVGPIILERHLDVKIFLVKLEGDPEDVHPSVSSTVLEIVKSLQYPESVTVEGIGRGWQDFWNSTCRYSTVEDIAISSNNIPWEMGGDYLSGGFQSASSVEVGWVPVSKIPFFLRIIKSGKLEALSIYCSKDDDEEFFPDSFATIPHFTQLTLIRIDLGLITPKWEEITPLLSCQKITDFYLNAFALFDVITDDKLRLIAQSWPNLEDIDLDDLRPRPWDYGGEGESGPPKATMRGLLVFSEFCPKLTKLAISVDARGITGEEAIPFIARGVKNLDFYWSRAKESNLEDIASFITRAWPACRKRPDEMRWNAGHGDQDDDESDDDGDDDDEEDEESDDVGHENPVDDVPSADGEDEGSSDGTVNWVPPISEQAAFWMQIWTDVERGSDV